jgi:uncharacterized surface protein with fasciclin (FAS1) repeats
MKVCFPHHFKSLLIIAGVIILSACNKEVPEPVPIEPEVPSVNQTIADLLNDASFSLLKSAATKAGLLETLSDKTAVYTLFAPDDAAMQRSGINSAVIAALPADQLKSILQYHLVGGRVNSAKIPTTFPNLQLPSLLQLQPPGAIPTGLRMSVFASKRGNNAWVNNVPLTAVDIPAANGIIHKTATVVSPAAPEMLWNRINADPNLTFLKAAIQRADQATPSANLVAALSNGGANLTVFAPSDASMRLFLIGSISQALIARGLPAATAQAAATALVTVYGSTVITNPAAIPDAPIFPTGTGIGAQLANVLTPTAVQGIVLYHVLGVRAFTVNFPATAALTKTLLNNAIAAHPGINLQTTFGATGVTAATAKGVGNQTASNLQLNPTPAPGGTSDQNYINGVLHVIDQALLPQ